MQGNNFWSIGMRWKNRIHQPKMSWHARHQENKVMSRKVGGIERWTPIDHRRSRRDAGKHLPRVPFMIRKEEIGRRKANQRTNLVTSDYTPHGHLFGSYSLQEWGSHNRIISIPSGHFCHSCHCIYPTQGVYRGTMLPGLMLLGIFLAKVRWWIPWHPQIGPQYLGFF